MKNKTNPLPYTEDWCKLAREVAQRYVGSIYPCRSCNFPVIRGYICESCNDQDPSGNKEDIRPNQ